jgi:hypothetical protein
VNNFFQTGINDSASGGQPYAAPIICPEEEVMILKTFKTGLPLTTEFYMKVTGTPSDPSLWNRSTRKKGMDSFLAYRQHDNPSPTCLSSLKLLLTRKLLALPRYSRNFGNKE